MIPISADRVPFTGDYADYERVPAGAYVCRVVKATPVPQKEYLLLHLDIAEGEFAGYGEKTEERTGKDFGYVRIYKKWADNGKTGKEENRNPYFWFKQMLARFEQENPGKYEQTNLDEQKLVGLLIGVVLCEEEYVANDGEVKKSVKFFNFATIDKIRSGKVKTPAMKKLPADENPQSASLINETVAVDDTNSPF